MQARLALGNDVHHNQPNFIVKITGTLYGKGVPVARGDLYWPG